VGEVKVETLIVDYGNNAQTVVTAGAVSCCGSKRNVVQVIGLTAVMSHFFQLRYTQVNFASP
jgi:hypothetical protein